MSENLVSETIFADRHIGARREADVAHMLKTIGYDSVDSLVDTAVPESIRQQNPLVLQPALSEVDVLKKLRELASKNKTAVQLIGQGYYDTVTPPVIRRNILEDPAWYTAYTPYQPEISQGRLEALLNFQTMVSDLTALPIANASLLDEATAVAEAVLLMRRSNKKLESGVIVLDADVLPQTISVVKGRAEALGFDVVVVDLATNGLPEGDICGIVLQQPGVSGTVHDHAALITEAKERGAMVTVAADLLALTLIVPPGEQGADIAVGSAQRFGVPLFFGGPHAAYMAVRNGLERSLPGRLVGVSKDDAGTPAYRLALQTREQHIRREKATSNICTAQALLAIVASMYAVYHGPEGLKWIAQRTQRHAATLAASLKAAGIEVPTENHFDTLTVKVPGRAAELLAAAEAKGLNFRPVDADTLGISFDETTTSETVALVASVFGASVVNGENNLPENLLRSSEYLTHPVFHAHRSETQMLRYLRRLSDRDLALDRTMIPLGSCTMKLNATVEMESISWPEFAGIHPFAPDSQTAGWRELIEDLETELATITGYDQVSIQPNAGSQGELAGLLAIRGYHLSRGDVQRTVCLIPASAHGTNAASAVLAGMKVVVVATAPDGTIDHDDLNAKIEANAENLAAIMITYPSTHGVFDADVRQVCDAIHAAGGQVYIDGANLNALVGLAQPGQFGGDVSHLNLHKTFCIPHGGGGPGVGPGLRVEGRTWHRTCRATRPQKATTVHGVPISAAPLRLRWPSFRSPGLYVPHHGRRTACTEATRSALLERQLRQPRASTTTTRSLYTEQRRSWSRTSASSTCANSPRHHRRHRRGRREAPDRLRLPRADAELSRSPGTLMVEPTESLKTLGELDRFIEAMISIKGEIDEIAEGKISVEDSALRLSPHTANAVVNDSWDRKYSREQAAFPLPTLRVDKYFPPVGRIDGANGDRNLICSCPPPEAFEN
jgi:glycine dehydrogenase